MEITEKTDSVYGSEKMKWRTKKFLEQSSTFDSFNKFFKWIAKKEKNPEKREKYLTMIIVSKEMSEVCRELAEISEGLTKK